MRSFLTLAGFCLALPLVATAQTGADRALQHVPDDAALVVLIPDFEKLISGVAAFGKAIDVKDVAELDVKKALEEPFGDAATGLDPKGAYVLVMSPEMTEPLGIAPLADEEAWKKAATPETAEGGLLRVEIGYDTHYAAIKDKYLIFAPDEAAVQAALKSTGKFAKTFKQRAGDLAGKHQFVIFVDVPKWTPMLQQFLMMGQGMIQMGLAAAGPQSEALTGMLTWALDSIRTLLDNAEVYAAAGTVGAEGVQLQDLIAFKPDGKIADYLKKVRKSDEPLLRALPDGDYAMIFGYEWMLPEGTEGATESMLKGLMSAMPTTNEAVANELQATLKKSIELYRKVNGVNGFMMSAPGGKGMVVCGLYLVKDAPAVLKQVVEITESGQAWMEQFAPGAKLNVTRSQETIAGVETHVLKYAFEDAESEVAQTLQIIYGEAPAAFVAARPEGVLMTMGPTDAARALAEKTLAGKAAKLEVNARVKAVMDKLPPKPQACFVADVAKLVDWVLGIARAQGEDIPDVKLPTTPQPLAVAAMYLDKDTVRGVISLPAEPLKAVIKAFEAAEGATEEGGKGEPGEM